MSISLTKSFSLCKNSIEILFQLLQSILQYHLTLMSQMKLLFVGMLPDFSTYGIDAFDNSLVHVLICSVNIIMV